MNIYLRNMLGGALFGAAAYAAFSLNGAIANGLFSDRPALSAASDPSAGTRFGSMTRDTLLYTKEQADALFAQGGGQPAGSGYPGNAYVMIEDGEAKVYPMPETEPTGPYPGNAYIMIENGEVKVYPIPTILAQ